jgi:hypothetical protein
MKVSSPFHAPLSNPLLPSNRKKRTRCLVKREKAVSILALAFFSKEREQTLQQLSSGRSSCSRKTKTLERTAVHTYAVFICMRKEKFEQNFVSPLPGSYSFF